MLRWTSVAVIGLAYSLFAAFGSGLEVLMWGIVLMLVGVPVFYICRRAGGAAPLAPPHTQEEAP
jgi:hypothetical protein